MISPLVSIITPCFNNAAFIEACIESVLAQTYPNVEHIIQDGASTDGTLTILQKYNDQVHWASEPDKGQADGLDKAIKRSRGDILLVLNADDMLLPEAANWAVQQMQLHREAAVVYGDLYLIDELGRTFGEFKAFEYDFASVFCVEKVIPAQATFMRRSALEAVGLGADSTLDTCPDYEMLVRLGLKFPMVYVPGFVTKYRHYPRFMDGATPRTVDRFIAAKALVMERVFKNADTPAHLKRLRNRAQTGLYLWASQEARGMGLLGAGWTYYAEALKHFSWWGSLAGSLILAVLKYYRWNRDRRKSRRARRVTPNQNYVLWVGAGLWNDTLRRPLPRWPKSLTRLANSFWSLAGKVIRGGLTLAIIAAFFYLVYLVSRLVQP